MTLLTKYLQMAFLEILACPVGFAELKVHKF